MLLEIYIAANNKQTVYNIRVSESAFFLFICQAYGK